MICFDRHVRFKIIAFLNTKQKSSFFKDGLVYSYFFCNSFDSLSFLEKGHERANLPLFSETAILSTKVHVQES